MRIIGGELKSRKIRFPKSKLTRPMTDRSKETVFNVLGGLVFGKHVLDLFAGSGSLGLEALSRGAIDTTFVDRADWAVQVIRKNLSELELESRAVVFQSDVIRAIDKLAKKKKSFSLVFIDPPFNANLVKKTLIKLDQSGIVLPFGQIVVGHTRQEEIPEAVGDFRVTRVKRIGQACLSFLFRVETQHEETKSYIAGEV